MMQTIRPMVAVMGAAIACRNTRDLRWHSASTGPSPASRPESNHGKCSLSKLRSPRLHRSQNRSLQFCRDEKRSNFSGVDGTPLPPLWIQGGFAHRLDRRRHHPATAQTPSLPRQCAEGTQSPSRTTITFRRSAAMATGRTGVSMRNQLLQ
jgi:hypothetical protein